MSVKEITYHQYQQIIDLDYTMLKSRRTMKPNIIKTKDGCFNCKRRKKKCDEQKPHCKACIRNSLECIWPNHVKLRSEIDNVADGKDKEVTLKSIEKKLLPDLDQDIGAIVKELDLELRNSMSDFDSMFDLHNDFVLDQFLNIQSQNISLDDSYLSYSNSDPVYGDTISFKPDLIIPGVKMSENGLICYDTFLNIMLKSISYSHCDPKMSPTALILPFVESNYIVREVALACGASLLTYHRDSFKTEAIQRYNKVVGLLIKELKDTESSFGNHLFVCVQLLQTLCLRDKNIGFNITLCAAHFSSSYGIIKKRFLTHSLPLLQNSKALYKTTPLDRFLVDHFVLHYPLNIMLCRFSKLTDSVPSPFKFFERFLHLLEQPVYGIKDSDPWLNHPVAGIGLKAQAIAAKCSWICRFLKTPASEEDLITYFSLLVDVTRELEILTKVLEDNPNLSPQQIANVHLSKAILYADLIILKKVCYYEKTTIESLQETVNMIISEENLARQIDPEGCISSIWTLFIGASTSTTIEQKKFFSKMLKSMADQVHSTICLKILKYLNIVWVDDIGDDSESAPLPHVGFEFLFDTTVLDIISD